MITPIDYLKSFKRMTDKEQLEYLARVDKWTEQTYPRLAALDDSWKEADMKDFDEGLKLASAFQRAHPFISQAQRYDAKKRLDKLNKFLNEVRVKSGMSMVRFRPQNDPKRYMAVVPADPKMDENGVEMPRKPFVAPEVDGRRPDHFKEYKDKLPADLQVEGADIAQKYDLLAHWRQRAEILALDPRANKALISNAAKKAVRIEAQILNFWNRVDVAFAKATGKPVDEAEVKELKEEAEKLSKEPKVEVTKADIDVMEEGEEKENAKRARVEANKKYLRRNDAQMTDERKEQIVVRMTELLEWGIEPSIRAIDNCEKNGIVVPLLEARKPAVDVQEPVAEEPVAEEPAIESAPVKEEDSAKEAEAPKVIERGLFD